MVDHKNGNGSQIACQSYMKSVRTLWTFSETEHNYINILETAVVIIIIIILQVTNLQKWH